MKNQNPRFMNSFGLYQPASGAAPFPAHSNCGKNQMDFLSLSFITKKL